MRIDYVDGLLQTSLTLNYKGQALTIDKLVIDTGASHTLLSADAVADVGVFFENGDEIESVQLGDINIENVKLDVGSLHEKLAINGLLGLDLLMKANIVLDLAELVMYSANPSQFLVTKEHLPTKSLLPFERS
ncbi:hypothetical protein [Paenibacillus tengchongensis]|uniref:hypothetical protein n=1 Tax=Paenibacillus tengchongensis TaxID=2608684 RepID=UPI00124D0E9E|nr:hypothetical protein [Paenibacillus tengchongensis]